MCWRRKLESVVQQSSGEERKVPTVEKKRCVGVGTSLYPRPAKLGSTKGHYGGSGECWMKRTDSISRQATRAI